MVNPVDVMYLPGTGAFRCRANGAAG